MLKFDDSRCVDAKQYHSASFSTRNSTLNTSLRKPIRMQDFIQLCDSTKYGFSPDLGGKNGGDLSMRMQVILDSSQFRPPGFSSYMGWEERRVQGLDYALT